MVRRPPVDLRVLDGIDQDTRPTVQLKYVDAGELYLTWRWEHAPDQPRVFGLPRKLVGAALTELAGAVPAPLAGEPVDRALARSLHSGPMAAPGRERRLTENLAKVLFPSYLAAELTALLDRGVRPHLRIQPAPSTGQVPWEALRLSAGERLVHVADVSTLPPASLRNAPGRQVSPWRPDGPVVAVLDPLVPGSADTELGSVLGAVDPDGPLAGMLAALGPRLVPPGPSPVRRPDLDRDTVAEALRTATRWLYVGHVTTAGHGLGARLHLCCGPDTTGRAELVGRHRPLTAADLVLGHRPEPARPWRIPNRVALVACESGGEVRFAEPAGLVAAMVHGGAEYVTSTRWPLLTDAGLAALVPGAGPAFAPAVVAVNAAHEAPDPVAALGGWQRELADRWERTGDPACSPLLWGAFSTAFAPTPR